MIKIAVIDKHPVARLGVGFVLRESFKDITVWESESPGDFFKSFPETKPDVVVLGFCEMVSSHVIDTLNLIKSHDLGSRIVILDGNPEPKRVSAYLRADVSGYLSKQNSTTEIVDCINLVLAGKRYVGLNMVEWMIESFVTLGNAGSGQPSLTHKQYEIANYICQGLPIPKIAETLGKNASTIRSTKYRIYKRLKINSIVNLRKLVDTIVLKG